jgi:DHA1 family tetracycline resistance protein-like MFS transporter
MRKPSVGIIFLTVFIDLIGFGIIIPLLPLYGKAFQATGLELGLLGAIFSIMQFICGPLLGRLSDRIGRRPVLLLSTAAAAVSYVIFAFGSGLQGQTALMVLFISRGLAGACGANITVAQAYIADITPPADRSRKMGLIGMAFGLGFIFGPPLGALARNCFGITGPGWVAAAFCAANFLLAFSILPESRKPSSEHVARRPHLDQWLHTMTRPKVGFLIYIFFLATFAFTCFEYTLGLLICQKFDIDVKSVRATNLQGYLFAYAGVIGACVQGGLTGRLVKKMGEPKLIAMSLFLVALSLGTLPFFDVWTSAVFLHWTALLVLLAVLSIGSNLTRPPVFGMISNLTSADEQGVTIGVAQSMGALARILGPMTVVPLFYKMPPLPYVICGTVSLVTGLLAWQRLSRGYERAPAVTVEKAEA